jgi:hypothetical protein
VPLSQRHHKAEGFEGFKRKLISQGNKDSFCSSLFCVFFEITGFTSEIMAQSQSPLFVRTDSNSSRSSLDSANFDDDNNSIESEEIESGGGSRRQIVSRYNTDIHISDGYETVNFGIGIKSDEPYSPDPFAINYRKTADWDTTAKAQWQREWWFVPDLIEKYESVEHAEFTRPFDQFRVLLEVSSLVLQKQFRELLANKDYYRNGDCTRNIRDCRIAHRTT